ncbi:PA14 domain-containing protein [Fusarium keratoplasticum]|nr:PA14 domain-containing protein [Fusarium keratoplasticum]
MSQSTATDFGPDSQTAAQTTDALTPTSFESSSIANLQTTTNPEVSTARSSASNVATTEAGCISDSDCNQDEVCDRNSRQCIVPKPDQSCGNAGLEYAVYDNPYYNSDILDYADFDVTHFHGATPLFEGITDRVGIAQGQNPYYPPIKVYDDSEEMFLQYKAISHVALLYAPYSGDYEISVPVSDEITLVWVGGKAITDWTRENADVEQRYHYETREPQVVRIHLEAGSYNNLRILWANGQGEFSFILSIKAPNGDVIVDGTESNTDYLVRFPCGGEGVF